MIETLAGYLASDAATLFEIVNSPPDSSDRTRIEGVAMRTARTVYDLQTLAAGNGLEPLDPFDSTWDPRAFLAEITGRRC